MIVSLAMFRAFSFFGHAASILLVLAGCRQSAVDADDTGSGASDADGETDTTAANGSSASTGGGPKLPLKVLNWNVENFFNDKNDSSAPQEIVQSASQYQAQLNAVANVIQTLDPDIAVLQEVENQAVLEDLGAKLGGKYVSRSVIDAGDPRGIDIGMIAKLQTDAIVSHKDDVFTVEGTAGPQYTFARDCVEYHFTYSGRKIALLGVHFRSKSAPDEPQKRIAEAQRCKAIAAAITANDPSTGIIMLGDFNDLPGSNPYDVVKGAPPDEWLDAPSVLPAAEQYTFIFQGTKELIDHQFSNPIMRGMLATDSVVITRGANVAAASDHDPVFARYDVN